MMTSIDLSKFKSGIITIEAQSLNTEKFINLLWKNNIEIMNIKRINITTSIMDIRLKDYYKINGISKKTKTKIKILNRRGTAFLIIKAKKRMALFIGVFIFAGIIYYLSTFIWSVDIAGERALTPFEIRQQLLTIGIRPGISKKSINVNNIEKKLYELNPNIMWAKVRIAGPKLEVTATERQSPPNIITDTTICDLAAKKDGQIIRVYTKAGTAVVKKDDIVKKGQILVKGIQGDENNPYEVHADGSVIAKTFYEQKKTVEIKGKKIERTGKSISNCYINIKNNRLYLKKSVNKFNKYDTIIDKKGLIYFENIYETKEVPFELNKQDTINNAEKELEDKITLSLDKSTKVVNKIVNSSEEDNKLVIRLILIGEENIAVPQKVNEN
ncbi:MAG: stage sporulation protein [Clostridiaceae bacterium]|nr:stage sporulation protein [Clostridiaceae bacterium]